MGKNATAEIPLCFLVLAFPLGYLFDIFHGRQSAVDWLQKYVETLAKTAINKSFKPLPFFKEINYN